MNNGLSYRCSEFGHPFGEPLRNATAVEGKVCDTGAFHRVILRQVLFSHQTRQAVEVGKEGVRLIEAWVRLRFSTPHHRRIRLFPIARAARTSGSYQNR